MKVGELIELLEQYDPDTPVYYAYNYGDYWRTTVAGSVHDVSIGAVTYSDYHNMMKVADGDEEYADESKTTEAVILG